VDLLNQTIERAVDLLDRARSYRIRDDYYETSREGRQAALTLLGQAVELSRASADLSTEAACLMDIGRIHDMDGDYPTAIACAKEALTLYRNTGDPDQVIRTLQNLANLHYVVWDFGNCMEYARETLRLVGADALPATRASAHSILGNCYCELGRPDEGEDACRRAVDVAIANPDVVRPAVYISNFVTLLCERGRVHETGELCEVLRNILVNGITRDRVMACGSLARVCNVIGNYEEAVGYCITGIEYCRQICDQYSESFQLIELGKAQRALANDAAARGAYEQVIDLRKTFGDNTIQAAVAHRELSDLHEAAGDISLAHLHFKQYHAIDKHLFNEETDKKTRAMMVEMQVERAKQEAEIHRIRSVELAELNDALENANDLLQEQNGELEAQAAELQSQAAMLEEQAMQLQAQAIEMERLSTVDALTNLYNRRYLEEWMARELAQAQRYGTDFAVALADVDHFKSINDRFGHRIGDDVLKAVGAILQESCRNGDLVARYGGEEFVFAMPHTGIDEACAACERLREAVQAYPWTTIHPDLQVTMSFGLASDTSAPNHEQLLTLADDFLYQAKRSGRNRLCSAAASSVSAAGKSVLKAGDQNSSSLKIVPKSKAA